PPSRTSAPNAVMIPSEARPLQGLPPIHSAASSTSPSATENPGRNHLDLVISISIEYLLHRRSEEPGQRERERQRGRVALLLDRVDRLARHAHRLGQLPLRQTAVGPQLSDQVPHRRKACLTRTS